MSLLLDRPIPKGPPLPEVAKAQLTIKAVVAHADKLQADAARRRAADPYSNPWFPTTAAARKQFERKLTEIRVERGAWDAPADEDEAVALLADMEGEAAQRTIAWMDGRVARELVEQREEEQEAERARKRHQRRQKENERDRRASLQRLSLGDRVDRALAELAVIGNATPAAMDTDRITGGQTDDERAPGPRYVGDPAATARHEVIKCVRLIEEELERAQRRLVENERV